MPQKKCRDERICEKISITPQTFKNYKYQERCMTLPAFLTLLFDYKDYKVLNLIAEELGCIFYKLPDVQSLPNIELLKRTNEVMYDTARTVDSVVKSIEDGNYDKKEKLETKLIIKETLEALIALDIAINKA